MVKFKVKQRMQLPLAFKSAALGGERGHRRRSGGAETPFARERRCNSINSKYFRTLPQCDSNNLQAQGIKGTNMLLQSGLPAPALSPPSSPPPPPLPLPHISTFQHPDTVTAGMGFRPLPTMLLDQDYHIHARRPCLERSLSSAGTWL